MQEEITITHQLEREDYVRAMQLYLRKSGTIPWWYLPLFGVALVLVGVMIRLAGVTPIAITVLVAVAGVALGILGVYVLGPGYRYDRTPGLWARTRLCFSQEDIAFQSEEGAGLLPWELTRFWISPTDYYLIRSRQDYLIVPKALFADEETRRRFEALVIRANPQAICRRFGRGKSRPS